MLSRFVIAFLPGFKCPLISWLQSLSIVVLEPKKMKSVTVSIVFSSVCHEVMGLDAMILELSCFFDDPSYVGNLISGSSVFSKTILNICKFMVHVLLKPSWRILSISSLACEMSAVVW